MCILGEVKCRQRTIGRVSVRYVISGWVLWLGVFVLVGNDIMRGRYPVVGYVHFGRVKVHTTHHWAGERTLCHLGTRGVGTRGVGTRGVGTKGVGTRGVGTRGDTRGGDQGRRSGKV